MGCQVVPKGAYCGFLLVSPGFCLLSNLTFSHKLRCIKYLYGVIKHHIGLKYNFPVIKSSMTLILQLCFISLVWLVGPYNHCTFIHFV